MSSYSLSKNESSLSKTSSTSIVSRQLITLHERGDGFDQRDESIATGYSYSKFGSIDSLTSGEDSQFSELRLGSDLKSENVSSEEIITAGDTSSELLFAEKHTINQLEKMTFMLIIEDAIDQLQVVKHLLPKAYVHDDGYYQSLQARYELQGQRTLLYPNEGETPIETKLMKVERDRSFISTILKRVNDELKKESTLYTLAAAIEADQKMKQDDETLEKECATNERIIRNINKEMNGIAKTVEESEYRDSVKYKLLEGELHDTIMESDIEKRYVNKWETARQAQAKYRADLVEGGLTSSLMEARIGIDIEDRINLEIETYINMSKQELEDSIEGWVERYEREAEEKDRELLTLRMDRESNLRNLTELQEIFDLRKQELDEYNTMQEEIRLRLEREALLDKMATRIQAWWRGLMVRRCLGPFRKKKKGKKGKKDKKTEKKQKNKKK